MRSPRDWARALVLALTLLVVLACAAPGADSVARSSASNVIADIDPAAQTLAQTSDAPPSESAAPPSLANPSAIVTPAPEPQSPAPIPAAAPIPSTGSTTRGAGPSRAVVAPAGLSKIKHFVFIMQENHSFDSYFGTYPGADGLPTDICLPNPFGGPCVSPYHETNVVNRGGPHDWDNAVADVDSGAMDGFLIQAYQGQSKKQEEACLPPRPKCKPGLDPRDVMGYHDFHEIPNYWNYAHLYVLQDHMFSPVLSYTLPNRLYALAGQSDGYLSHQQARPTAFNFPEITEVLSDHGVSWKYYVTPGNEPDTTDGHVVGVGSTVAQTPDSFSFFNPLPAFPRIQNNPSQRARLVATTQFYADARSGNLPAVSWVVPNDAVSEHPPSNIQVGQAYVTGLVDAVMESPDWDSTAIFISYDEWGGFYDHVAPPRVDQYGDGLRVPGLVISPYAKQNYVDHHTYSLESWLRIVEERYDLPALTSRDARAADMLDAFDFTQKPRPPVILSATPQGSPYPHQLQVIQH